jgi:hypothetical protein
MAAAIALVFLKLAFISQFAALILIFVFPAAGLVLFRESHAVLKIARGFVYSTLISMGILALFVLSGIAVRQSTYLAALVLSSEFFLLVNLLRGRRISFAAMDGTFYATAALVAVIAGGLCFWGATRVVPVLQDHDSVMECPAYGLATTLKPYCIETRVPYYFAKGPTSHFIYAFPLVLTDSLERVKHYYDTSLAALNSPDPQKNIVSLWHGEFKRWFPKQGGRVIVETRTTSIFISVMLALLLFAMVHEITGRSALALALSIVFLTLPEIFVRNSYAGYQNISNFFLLLALYQFLKNKESVLTPLLLATINQKCVIVLGLAVGVWLLVNKVNWKKMLGNKTLIGLLAGMLLLYAYGAFIHPPSLLQDQLQRHGVDRLLHQNPIPGMDYPSFTELWTMFGFNYGVFFILLVILGAVLLFRNRAAFPRETVLLLLIMATAFAFSLVDWKMTKHLDLMVPAMVLVIALGFRDRLWSTSWKYRALISSLLLLALANNGWIICKLADNFSWLNVTPIW